MKKILIAITKSNFGGAQKYVFDISKSLSNKYEIVVVCGGEGVLIHKLKEINVKTISVKNLERDVNIFKDISSFFKLIKVIKRENPDILILNSSKIGGLGSLSGRLLGIKKIIFVIHGFALNEDRSFIQKIIIKKTYALINLLSHSLIAVSEAIYKESKKLPFSKNKIKLIKHGIEDLEFLTKEEARTKLGLKQKDFVVGTIAELHPIKGLEYAIDGIKKSSISNLNYVILGDGELKNKLQEKIKEENIEDRVLLKGYIKDAYKYSKAFDIFLLPSLSEALGYVLLEVGSAKIPIIATSVGGVPEIIKNEETGILIQPKNSEGVTREIENIQKGKYNLEELTLNLKKVIKKDFSIERMIEETEDLFKN